MLGAEAGLCVFFNAEAVSAATSVWSQHLYLYLEHLHFRGIGVWGNSSLYTPPLYLYFTLCDPDLCILVHKSLPMDHAFFCLPTPRVDWTSVIHMTSVTFVLEFILDLSRVREFVFIFICRICELLASWNITCHSLL
jgi:hypothetical protein